MENLNTIEPQILFSYFAEICRVPRPSKKEEKIRDYLVQFAKKNNLPVKTDKAGNVLISKPATATRENAPVIVLQSHMDMVCEKNSDKVFDFDTDAIEPYVDGNWVKAHGTTLGADCGIGIAAQLAILDSDKICHGPLECLFTVDEETGLSGARDVEPGFLTGKYLINLDSEDEGEIFIGCAGGIDTVATLSFENCSVPVGHLSFKITVKGLMGGHSGDDINKNRGNANKILARILLKLSSVCAMELAQFDGGNLRNAIAREAFALITVPSAQKEKLISEFNLFTEDIRFEYEFAEPGLITKLESTETSGFVMDTKSRVNLLNALCACPHGVLEMSSRMEGMVETSTNLASVKCSNDNLITVGTSQRSEIESRKYYAAEMVESLFRLAGFNVKHSEGYPGWPPIPGSEILNVTVSSYKQLFNTEPLVRSIHAGLECGLFLKTYPALQMVSFGPTIRGVHSPDERLDINTTVKFWELLVDILEKV